MRMSPSSRRAWIEIQSGGASGLTLLSPSSRRAWIEILQRLAERLDNQVALLAEGVDRNPEWLAVIFMIAGSPSSRRAQVEIDTKIW